MLSVLYIIYAGLMIGIFISAPMGPIGMLCIQRTLTRGRLTGFYTGLGAALSDVIYCLLAGLGLTFVEDFVTNNQEALRIVGSIVLIIYAIFLARSNPSRALRPGDHSKATSTFLRDFGTGFLFTFSNPLILLIIVSLMAQFKFTNESYQFYHYIAGYIAIAGGAVLWWTFITYAVNKVRAHFNLRSMRLLNRIIAIVISLMGVVGIIISL